MKFADLEIGQDFSWFPEGATWRKMDDDTYNLVFENKLQPGNWSAKMFDKTNQEVFTGCKC